MRRFIAFAVLMTLLLSTVGARCLVVTLKGGQRMAFQSKILVSTPMISAYLAILIVALGIVAFLRLFASMGRMTDRLPLWLAVRADEDRERLGSLRSHP